MSFFLLNDMETSIWIERAKGAAEDVFVRLWKDITWIGVDPTKEFMDVMAKNMYGDK